MELETKTASFAPAASPAKTLAVLSRVLKSVDITCKHSSPQRGDWSRLLSLQSLEHARLCLKQPADVAAEAAADVPAGAPQLTSLRSLMCNHCTVPLQPLFRSSATLQQMTFLQLWDCDLSNGLPAAIASASNLAKLRLIKCSLSSLPSLSQLTQLALWAATRLWTTRSPATATLPPGGTVDIRRLTHQRAHR